MLLITIVVKNITPILALKTVFFDSLIPSKRLFSVLFASVFQHFFNKLCNLASTKSSSTSTRTHRRPCFFRFECMKTPFARGRRAVFCATCVPLCHYVPLAHILIPYLKTRIMDTLTQLTGGVLTW